MISAARQHLGLGQSVVLDASWVDASNRGLAQALASESSADLTELHCAAPPDITEGRIASDSDGERPLRGHGRHRAGHGAHRGPWPSATNLDTARPPDVVLADALRVVGMPSAEVPSTG